MKTLLESILADIDDTFKQGDEYIKELSENFKNLQEVLSITKSYREVKTYNPGKFIINRYCKNLLKSYGFDADVIHLVIYLPGIYGSSTLNNCEIVIQIMKYENKGINSIYKTSYTLPKKDYTTLKDVVNKFIKPNIKDINTFKKLLKNEIS